MDDIVIIGAGPAGMTAAVYAVRKNLAVTIVSDNIGGQALYSSAVENYLGYQIHHRRGTYAVNSRNISRASKSSRNFRRPQRSCAESGTFVVETDRDKGFPTKTIIIASGKIPRRLGVPGEKEFAKRGVAYCATCDGPMFSGMDVAVIGGGNSGYDAAVYADENREESLYSGSRRPRKRADEVFRDHIAKAANAELRTNTAVRKLSATNL